MEEGSYLKRRVFRKINQPVARRWIEVEMK